MALCLNHVLELFFGGSLGSGKSDYLLSAALQYVDIPDYHALILRRTLADAMRAGSLMFRAAEWLTGTDAKLKGSTWYFPSGATLEFGSLDNKDDHFRYDGTEYAFIGVDEYTKLNFEQVDYVTGTRLRKPGCSIHSEKRDASCQYCARYMHTDLFPLRIRTASNPGGMSHLKVKHRYDIGLIPGEVGPMGYPLYRGRNPDRPHIPAFITDNPYIDANAYVERLKRQLKGDAVTLRQMLAGDWGVSAEGRFKQQWLKRWRFQSGTYEKNFVHLDGHQEAYNLPAITQFLTVDTASSVKSTPGRTEHGRKLASHTVVARWGMTPRGELMLFHVRRGQVELPGIEKMIRDEMVIAERPVAFVGIEHTTQSIHLYQYLNGRGLNLKPFMTRGQDKIQRAISVANLMEQGKVYLPSESSKWLTEYEDEIFTWTGADEETDDQVDVTSYAGIYVTQHGSRAGGIPILA